MGFKVKLSKSNGTEVFSYYVFPSWNMAMYYAIDVLKNPEEQTCIVKTEQEANAIFINGHPKITNYLKETTVKTFKVAVKTATDFDWLFNGLRFATRAEAEDYSAALFTAWTDAVESKVMETDDPVNSVWRDGKIVMIGHPELPIDPKGEGK